MTLRANDLAMMRSVAQETMLDTCVIQTLTSTGDGYDISADSWSDSAALDCGYQPARAREIMGGAQVIMMPATIRLPDGTSVTHLQRIKLTKRYGTTLTTPLYFAIKDEPKTGAASIVVEVESVPDTGVRDE
jgi:hypothetical protein